MRLLPLLLTALALAGPALSSQAPTAAPQRPNFVVIMTDDQTYRDMAAMPRTRRLIGAAGARFTRSYVSYPLCCPSRATYLTGQYNHNNGVHTNTPPQGGFEALDAEHTLPVWLSAAGYRTSHIGKYLNGYGLRRKPNVPPGWTDWHGGDRQEHVPDVRLQAVRERRRQPLRQLRRRGPRALPDRRARAEGGAVDRGHRAGHAALPVADVRRAARRVGRPRLDDPAVHPPGAARRRALQPPAHAARAARRGATCATSRPTCASCAGRARRAPRASRPTSSRGASRCSPSTRRSSRVVGALARTGRLGSTYVLFTSDNGFFQGEHRIQKGKYLAYDPSSHVPLMIRGPGIPAGTVSGELVTNADLAPTILEAAGASADRPMDGRSLLPFARDGRFRTRRPVLHEGLEAGDIDRDGAPTGGTVGEYHAIRTARYLYIEWINGAIELYDRARDPNELRVAPPRPPLPADPPLAAPRAGAPAHLRGRRLPAADGSARPLACPDADPRRLRHRSSSSPSPPPPRRRRARTTSSAGRSAPTRPRAPSQRALARRSRCAAAPPTAWAASP